MSTPTLALEGLKTWFFTGTEPVKAVDGVSFAVMPGEIMGLVGESGSGKSITGFSVMGLVEPPGRVVDGRILLSGQDLRACTEAQWRKLRGNRVAMIFQDPMMTLNPVLRIDQQMTEALHAHQRLSRSAALQRAGDALARVGIAAPDERLRAYPHQMSGGMRQRVAIAIALLNEPQLIIADEPTTALDVTIQAQILFEMQKICASLGTSLVWITHDLSVVAGLADSVGVMYGGRLVEHGSARQVLERPAHPYTRGLIASVPQRGSRGQRLCQIPGSLHDAPLRADANGCAFASRCDKVRTDCHTDFPLRLIGDGHALRCQHPD